MELPGGSGAYVNEGQGLDVALPTAVLERYLTSTPTVGCKGRICHETFSRDFLT
jgi:hypothetical protein